MINIKNSLFSYDNEGSSICLLNVDMPKGYVTRIRRTKDLEYPTNSNDYVLRMLSLLELAAHGKAAIDNTHKLICQTRVSPSVSTGGDSKFLLRSFISSTTQTSSSSSKTKKPRKMAS